MGEGYGGKGRGTVEVEGDLLTQMSISVSSTGIKVQRRGWDGVDEKKEISWPKVELLSVLVKVL